AGLYLAALSLRDQPDPSAAAARFGGEDSAVVEYFRDECLSKLAPGAAAFLRRASVLDELSGPGCEAVLRRRGSAGMLSELARRDVMLVPRDRDRRSFRLHGL